jgi:hypothetical protein
MPLVNDSMAVAKLYVSVLVLFLKNVIVKHVCRLQLHLVDTGTFFVDLMVSLLSNPKILIPPIFETS